ncbi:cocaine esterase-like isoform X3 [Eriocheir sinensis]|uniref:cocaine esterase-like isoform X3 n=1 Tax=Eriocheir sinensis TaxID=95602 RepID=UPI0021C8144D|nr:cocaine esterase-like isoform X3 [Eriocheir sinensis]
MLSVGLLVSPAAWWWWWWWWCVGGVAGLASEGPVTLSTPSGKLRGERYVLEDGSRGVRFLGIPYAKPPLGPLRFAAPERAEAWEGVRDARHFGPMCYQPLENEVWDLVESEVDLVQYENQLRAALARELGGELYEEEMEEVEDMARKNVENAHRLKKKRKEQEKEEKCRGAGRGMKECMGWDLEYIEDNEEAEEDMPEEGVEVVTQMDAVFRTRVPAGGGGGDDSGGDSGVGEPLVPIEKDKKTSNRHSVSEDRLKNLSRAKRRNKRGREWKKKKKMKEEAFRKKKERRRGTQRRRLNAEAIKQKEEEEEEEEKEEKNYSYMKERKNARKDRRRDARKRRLSGEGRKEEEEGEEGDRDYLYMKEKSMSEYHMSEDCLTLNVYTPLLEGERGGGGNGGPRRRRMNASLPLVLYIHGGSFYSNGGRLYPGEKLASLGLVVVTINYRLGPFGFLSTGDEAARGNWGLLDQRLALLWTRRHARSFGASLSKVLLLGNSAGAASVILHLVSPLSSGLFTRAVALSGCALAPWSLQSRPLHFAQKLATDVGCTQSDTRAMVGCLRNTDADSINKVYGEKYVQDGLWLAFAPVVEGEQPGAFLPQQPRRLMEQGHLTPVPLVMTLTRDEVTIWFTGQSDITLEDAEKWIDMLMRQKYPALEPLALAAVMHVVRASYLYARGHLANSTATTTATPSTTIDSSNSSSSNTNTTEASSRSMALTRVVADLISDLGLRVPCVEEARVLSRWTTIYLAEFSYSSQDDVRVGGQEWIGSYHESELQFVFGLPFLGLVNTLRNTEDRTVAATFMQLLGSFAHTGVPNVSGVEWPAYNQSHLVHLQMSDSLSLGYNLVQPRLCFWEELIPLLTLWPITPPKNDPSGTSSLTPPLPPSSLTSLKRRSPRRSAVFPPAARQCHGCPTLPGSLLHSHSFLATADGYTRCTTSASTSAQGVTTQHTALSPCHRHRSEAGRCGQDWRHNLLPPVPHYR